MSSSVATDSVVASDAVGPSKGALKSHPIVGRSHSKDSGETRFALVACLAAICTLASAVRLFSVITYESVIHEFDPYFNYRVTRFLTTEGFYKTWNFFDSFTWYPLGRVIGGTMYPGLIFTAGAMWNLLTWLNIPIHVQEVCVFTAPVFAAFCALATFLFMREVRGPGAGLASAALISVVPSYISRSVAGSFDLEAVAIFALMFVFFLYVKTLNTGSLAWATGLFFAYLYMVASWGGYSFIVNLLPIHCLACIIFGRVSYRLYVAYAPFVVMGALACMNIPVIGFNAVLMSEHFASFLVFGLLHVVMVVQYTKQCLTPAAYQAAKRATLTFGAVAASTFVLVVASYVAASPTFGWTGRSLSLLDPTYASKYIPIIASVSEHQPPNWSMYFTDLHVPALLAPAGIIMCFMPLTDASLFLALYGVTAVYFSGVMVRLMLVLAPAVSCLGGLALSEVLAYLGKSLVAAADGKSDAGEDKRKEAEAEAEAEVSSKATSSKSSKASDVATTPPAAKNKTKIFFVSWDIALIGFLAMSLLLAAFFRHGVYVAGKMYSAPSIVMQSGGRVYDDFREAYAWMRFNTPEDAKIASWWDYGYQTTAMSNRTVLVDNNTWNNTHIATVGKAMASTEKGAWDILESLDADYVFVIFGGLIGYPSDDINKFLWMVRIGGGVYPELRESDFLGKSGSYRVDSGMGEGLRNSLVYKLSYYRFSDMPTGQPGFDRVRNTVIGDKDFKLEYFEEVLTTSHWMVRVYKRKKAPNADFGLENGLKA